MSLEYSFGSRLIYYRKKKNLKQKELAELACITPTALNYYEKDKREPNVDIIKRLAKALEISGDELLGISNYPIVKKGDTEPCAGEDEIFIQSETFSLDAYAKERGMSDLDLVLIKLYLDMPKEMRLAFMNRLRETLGIIGETVTAKELSPQNNATMPDFDLDTKEGLLAAVAWEYENEKSTASSVSQNTESEKSTKKRIS